MIAFTICSNNYLAKAKVLLDSIKSRENVAVFLFLADQRSEKINYELLGFDDVIFPTDLEIPNLQWRLENYNIIEFNTSIKAKAFEYLFKISAAETIYYFDPDIKVYRKLGDFDMYWKDKSILLTPHILSPPPFDGCFPEENLFLNHGIYNLGFLGLRKTSTSEAFLEWWACRLQTKCIIDLKDGYFTDQIWFNLVPLFFKDVEVLVHHGFNVAYWNLHEREVHFNNGHPTINDKVDLFFYHFSNFDPHLIRLMPSEKMRYNFDDKPEVLTLYKDYHDNLNMNSYLNEISIPYYNGNYPLKKTQNSILKRLIVKISRVINHS